MRGVGAGRDPTRVSLGVPIVFLNSVLFVDIFLFRPMTLAETDETTVGEEVVVSCAIKIRRFQRFVQSDS